MAKKRQKVRVKQKSEALIDFLKRLPEGRKIYYRIGNIMVEVTKEEAIELIQKEEVGLKKFIRR